MIIVVSHVHLDYDACDKDSFNNFIEDKLVKLNKNILYFSLEIF